MSSATACSHCRWPLRGALASAKPGGSVRLTNSPGVPVGRRGEPARARLGSVEGDMIEQRVAEVHRGTLARLGEQ
jgi:hypothetical protein